MLNLFAYTGSFTVYAAAGGAIASDTVDLSNTYLDWAARNFAGNGLDRARHQLIRADVLAWLDVARGEGRRYDLIVLDPPAFSNSKAMDDVLDIQRDHARMVAAARALLARAASSTSRPTCARSASTRRSPRIPPAPTSPPPRCPRIFATGASITPSASTRSPALSRRRNPGGRGNGREPPGFRLSAQRRATRYAARIAPTHSAGPTGLHSPEEH